jgi:ornithine cyclodeaminase
MVHIFDKDQIKSVLNKSEIIDTMETGFKLYSTGKVTVPPVGHMPLEKSHADVHIKYGYIQDSPYYVIKVASGFYDNPKIGLSSSNGLMLVFSQKTGELIAILLDEGFLTDVRTGAAGAVAAKYLAPKNISRIGIIGTGIQAHMQLKWLATVTDCRKVTVWGRTAARCTDFAESAIYDGFRLKTTDTITDVTETCNLIVTATAATEPILTADMIRPGTHITAVGADTYGKQELDPKIFKKADIVVGDSIRQVTDHGDISYAIKARLIDAADIRELGNIITHAELRRQNDEQITVADLTGVAVQDIQIATMVCDALLHKKSSLKIEI